MPLSRDLMVLTAREVIGVGVKKKILIGYNFRSGGASQARIGRIVAAAGTAGWPDEVRLGILHRDGKR
jgi:hypothetical protein